MFIFYFKLVVLDASYKKNRNVHRIWLLALLPVVVVVVVVSTRYQYWYLLVAVQVEVLPVPYCYPGTGTSTRWRVVLVMVQNTSYVPVTPTNDTTTYLLVHVYPFILNIGTLLLASKNHENVIWDTPFQDLHRMKLKELKQKCIPPPDGWMDDGWCGGRVPRGSVQSDTSCFSFINLEIKPNTLKFEIRLTFCFLSLPVPPEFLSQLFIYYLHFITILSFLQLPACLSILEYQKQS